MTELFGSYPKRKWLNFHRRAGVWKWLTWQQKCLNFRYTWQSLLEVIRKWKWLNFHKRAGVWNFGSDWQDNKNIEFTLYRNFGRDWHDTENRLTLRYTGTLGKNWLDTGKIEITLYWNFRWDWHDTESLLTLRYTENLGETDPTAKRQKIYRYTWQNLFSSFGDAWNRRKLICLKRWKICTWLAKYLKRRIFW